MFKIKRKFLSREHRIIQKNCSNKNRDQKGLFIDFISFILGSVAKLLTLAIIFWNEK